MRKIFRNLDVYSIKNYLGNIEDKEGIIECIKRNQLSNLKIDKGYDFPLTQDYNSFFYTLHNKIQTDFKKIFNCTISEKSWQTCNSYMSDKDNYAEQWHNHIETGVLSAIYYFNIPCKTSINFLCERNEKLFTHSPSNDELLIFPSHLYHKPNRCFGDGYRISINLDVLCKESSRELFSRIKKQNQLTKFLQWVLK